MALTRLCCLLPTCYCLMIVMKRNSSQAGGSAATSEKVVTTCPLPAVSTSFTTPGTLYCYKTQEGGDCETSRTFVSSSTGDTALKHKTGTGIGTKLRKAPSEISHHVIWVPCGGGLDREIVSRRLISSDEFTFHTSILAPQAGTPSHLHTQTRGTTQLCVYSPMVWHYNCRTAALMLRCHGATVSYLG